MDAPECPEHGTLVLDLASGVLGDRAASEGEAARESCPVCRAWWVERLAGEGATAVDAAVSAAIDGFTAPRSRRTRAWIATAATAVAAIGAGLVWYAASPPTSRTTPEQVVRGVFDGVTAPSHDLNNDGVTDASDLILILAAGH